jgi:phytoene desaturase
MKGKSSVVIIGAGIGGITNALYLAKNGYNVRVYEKNTVPGGRSGQIMRDGHRFDLGATMLLMPSVYRDVFRDLDLNFEESLKVRRLADLYKLYFDDGDEIAFTTDKDKMRLQFEAIEKGSFRNSESYISEGYEFFKVAYKKLIGRNFYSIFQFATLKNAIMLMKFKTYITHQKYIQRFFNNPHLQMAFTFQNIYVGQSPFDAPAFFSMIPAVELIEGSLFPEGGIYSVTEKLLSEAVTSGVEFHFGKPVSKIELDRDIAKGIILEGGEKINADIIVANADLPYVYRELLPDKKISGRIDRMKYSCSAMVFHWGLDRKYQQLGHHSVFLSDGFRTGLKSIFKDKSIDSSPSFYVHAPTRTDTSAAPDGQDTLSIIVGVGHLDEDKKQDWNDIKNRSRMSVIERLKKAGLADIDKHIKFEICYPPKTWETVYNISRGSVFGSLSHHIMQMGYFRPHNRHNKYKNLYFVGGSTHPGNGIPLVLLSAKLTAERIIKEEEKRT